MWTLETDPAGRGLRRRRAIALALVAMLISVLSAFSLAAVGFLLTSLSNDSSNTAEMRALYLAELGRADASAYVASHPTGPWPRARNLTAITDDRGAPAGEYTYTITDLTLPEQNQRRLAHVHAYWPTQASAAAEYELRVWLEQRDGTWRTVAWATGACAVGG